MGKDNGYGGKKEMKITSSRRLSVCRYCGRKIIWIQTKAGRNMPCDPELISYRIPDRDSEWGSGICRPGIWQGRKSVRICTALCDMREEKVKVWEGIKVTEQLLKKCG